MVLLLNKSLRSTQWISLVVLVFGISVIQVQNVNTSKAAGDDSNPILGLFAVITACILSGLAGVYFEKILKNSKVSIWVRNIQLGVFGTFFALITSFVSDHQSISEHGNFIFLIRIMSGSELLSVLFLTIFLGFFFGYTSAVWINIVIQAAGGLLVALVIKYADNILKGFATSIAIIVSCVASAYLFGTIINLVFAFGTFLVVFSVVLYSYVPPSGKTLPTKIPQIIIDKSQANTP